MCFKQSHPQTPTHKKILKRHTHCKCTLNSHTHLHLPINVLQTVTPTHIPIHVFQKDRPTQICVLKSHKNSHLMVQDWVLWIYFAFSCFFLSLKLLERKENVWKTTTFLLLYVVKIAAICNNVFRPTYKGPLHTGSIFSWIVLVQN